MRLELMMADEGRSEDAPQGGRRGDQVSPEVREVLHMLRMLERGESKPVKADKSRR